MRLLKIMDFQIQRIPSIGNVRLEVLTAQHENDLTQLAREQSIWEFAPHPCHEPAMFKAQWLDKALMQMQQYERVCFVIKFNETVVGSSSYYDIDSDNKKLNIGYTWLHPTFAGNKINPRTKLIMLTHAIENLAFNRVGFAVDSLNQRSSAALKKLGITYEGTLRNYLILPSGRVRHSLIYSVTREEWPETKDIIKQQAGISCI
jgi:RimJ/RimL family protein N-acetyltransferase